MLKYEDGIIELNNVQPVEQFGEIQYYTTLISIEELYEINERIYYDAEAQRGESNGKPLIDSKHVNQIYEAFMNGDSIRGHLTWNLRKQNDGSNYIFNEETGKLVIKEAQMITIPDSAHRHEALKLIAESIDDESILSSKFALDIYTISKSEEKELFYTINGKIKAPNKNRTLYLSSNIECKLLRDMISQSNLEGRIECTHNNAHKDGKLTKFVTLYESLFGKSTGSFSKEAITEENYDEHLRWLIDFYNELLETRTEFKLQTSDEKLKSKQDSMTLEELSWWGYGLLAKEFKNDRKWRHKLHNFMNKRVAVDGGVSIDFLDKKYPMWHATVIKPRYNFMTQKQEIGNNVTNSNTTRNTIKKVFMMNI